MFVTVHTAVGLALTQNFTSPLLAAAVAFASHLLLDIIPHGDDILTKGWRRLKVGLVLGLPDTVVLIILFLGYMLWLPPGRPLVAIAAAAGAVLPDMLWGLATFVKWPPLQAFDRFHEKIHNLLNSRLTMRVGFGLQAITLALAGWWLFA